jgi:hypothetical protein
MKIPLEENKFLSQWDYYEVARYVPSLKRVIRDKVADKPLVLNSLEVEEYAKANGNTGIYTSVFAYNSKDIDLAMRLGPLYFDIDSPDIESAKTECISLYEHLTMFIPKDSVLVYFTGKKGFHIECEPIALGINPSNALSKVFRYIANDLKDKLSLSNLDFSVYDQRRMWRYPGSKHQDTSLHKTLLNSYGQENLLYKSIEEISNYCSQKRTATVCDQEFSYKANEWYRQYTYEMEESQNKKQDPLEYFNKYGSKAFKDLKETHKYFDPKMLLTKCSAVKRLYLQAKEEGYLEHEARLFLCSILTYTEDSIKFLHEILSNCRDYNFEKSSAHINDWVKRRQMGIGGRPYTCERANSVGVGCGDCSLEQRNKWIKIGDRYVETQEKSSPSPIRFAYRSLKEGELDNGNKKS